MIYRIYDDNRDWGEWEGEDDNDAVKAMLADYFGTYGKYHAAPDLETLRVEPLIK